MPHAATAPQLYGLWKSAVDLNNIKVWNLCQLYVLVQNPKVNQFALQCPFNTTSFRVVEKILERSSQKMLSKNKTKIIWLLLVYFKV